MRRLTLILSDLYLSENTAGAELPRTHSLPQLESLLRVAESTELPDWRRWLLAHGAGGHPGRPLAESCAVSLGLPAGSAWLATPVHLEARLDHVRLSDRGLLRVEPEEGALWCAEFNQVFGPQLSLHPYGSRAFVLTGLEGSGGAARDPARALGAEIGPLLPGADSPEVRRLWAEIEMWLHGSAMNATRERRRRTRISALWLWGREPGHGNATGNATTVRELDAELFGGDPLFECLARLGGAEPRNATAFSGLPGTNRDTVIVEAAPLTGDAAEALPALESNWFTPARAALDGGALEELTVIANDRCFRIGRHASLRFWRRRRRWLDLLAVKA
jgi:hypothetical protein